MFDMTKDQEYIDYELQQKVENTIYEELQSLVKTIEHRGYNLVLVTNEIGYSLVPNNHIGRVFRDIQGDKSRVAALSNEVYLVCCGIPVKNKMIDGLILSIQFLTRLSIKICRF